MWCRRLTRRLSYANVVATLALFVALGGASYAATSLPAGSVGTRQLAFPLGTVSSTASFTQRLDVTSCSEPCPPPTLETKPLRSVAIMLAHPTKLLILGSANLLESSSTAAAVVVDLSAQGSGRPAGTTTGLVSSDSSHLAFWQIISAPSGRQLITLHAVAYSNGSTDHAVLVNNAQLGVVVIPALK